MLGITVDRAVLQAFQPLSNTGPQLDLVQPQTHPHVFVVAGELPPQRLPQTLQDRQFTAGAFQLRERQSVLAAPGRAPAGAVRLAQLVHRSAVSPALVRGQGRHDVRGDCLRPRHGRLAGAAAGWPSGAGADVLDGRRAAQPHRPRLGARRRERGHRPDIVRRRSVAQAGAISATVPARCRRLRDSRPLGLARAWRSEGSKLRLGRPRVVLRWRRGRSQQRVA
mmetsp:Transcript_88400/g.270562  ORF Transcript_88400/g.270562 Transcript_88400/m.270562 type:complete len:223 (-) Transcript_88400:61-729(-)